MDSEPKVSAVILAGGSGLRLSSDIPKQYLEIGREPVLTYSIKLFDRLPFVNEIVIVAAKEWLNYVEVNIIASYSYEKPIRLVAGGEHRQESSFNGVLAANEPYVMIHDGARPFAGSVDIEQLYLSVVEFKAAVLAVPVTDTIKEAACDMQIIKTTPRDRLWAAQTPQAFCREILIKAHRKALSCNFLGTDEASLLEFLGEKVMIVEGSRQNIKITTQEDLVFADFLLRRNKS